MDDFENLSDDDIQQLMALGVAPDQLDAIKEQIATAQGLRDKAAPAGRRVGPDNVYVAASPLEHIANAMQGIKAGRDIKKLRTDQQSVLAQQIRARSKYFQKMNDTPEARARKTQSLGVDQNLVTMPDVNY